MIVDDLYTSLPHRATVSPHTPHSINTNTHIRIIDTIESAYYTTCAREKGGKSSIQQAIF